MSARPQLVTDQSPASTGPLCATLLAAAIGCCAMGLLTMFAALNKPFNTSLAFYKPSGALSGEATLAVLIWLVSWFLLAKIWRFESPRQGVVLPIAYLLLFIGLLTCFPPFLHLFAHS